MRGLLQHLFCKHYGDDRSRRGLSADQRRAIRNIQTCRTAAQGTHLRLCPNLATIHHLKGQVKDLTQMACRSVKPRQKRVNRFVFLGKKIRIPTRGWAVQRARSGRQKRESTLLSGQPRRWNGIDMGRLLAATAARDRAASRPLSVSGTAFVAQVAVGISENGGGSRRRFGLVFGEEKREHSDSNKALKVQNPADGVLPLTADVGME